MIKLSELAMAFLGTIGPPLDLQMTLVRLPDRMTLETSTCLRWTGQLPENGGQRGFRVTVVPKCSGAGVSSACFKPSF